MPKETLKDTDKPMTRQEFLALSKQMSDWESMNQVVVTGRVVGKTTTQPKPRLDKDKNHIHDEATGEPLYWEGRTYLDVAIEGAEFSIEYKQEFGDIEIGKKYQFTGRIGNVWGKAGNVFDTARENPFQ